MAKFSERFGLSSARASIQIDSMDDDLRTGLWNVLQNIYWENAEYTGTMRPGQYLGRESNPGLHHLSRRLWQGFFKRPLDELSSLYKREWPKVLKELRAWFFAAEWWEVYDFVEFVPSAFPDDKRATAFRRLANMMLEREASGWRFVGGELVPVTSDVEITGIERAIETAPTAGAREHLETALGMLSDRTEPDYRNSIKESISAVESSVRAATRDEKATLGQAIKLLDERHGLHPAMEVALSKLYGYTSDEAGIRHALMEEDDVTSAEARFMLVICSAFVSFLADPGPGG